MIISDQRLDEVGDATRILQNTPNVLATGCGISATALMLIL
jgi:hypothetical protein